MLPMFILPLNCETLPEEEIYRIAEDRLEELVDNIAGPVAPR